MLALLLLAPLALTACGAGDGDGVGQARPATAPAGSAPPATDTTPAAGTPSPVPSPPGPTELSEVPLPTLPRPKGPPSQPSDQAKMLSLSGTISVLPDGCLQLTNDRRVSYGLVGPLTDGLLPGSRVTLRGRPALGRGASTPCQGGVIRVLEVL